MDGLFPFQQGSALGDNLPVGEGLHALLRPVLALEPPLHNGFFPLASPALSVARVIVKLYFI